LANSQRVSGPELLTVLRQYKISMPIIFMTGHDDAQLRARTEAAGAVAFLAKPIDSDHLISAAHRPIDRLNQTRH